MMNAINAELFFFLFFPTCDYLGYIRISSLLRYKRVNKAFLECGSLEGGRLRVQVVDALLTRNGMKDTYVRAEI